MKKIIITIITFLFLFGTQSHADNVDVDLFVEGCNNNGICEAVIGENNVNCVLDCAIPAPTSGTKSGYIKPIKKVNDISFFNNIRTTHEGSSVVVRWESSVPTKSILRWGRTSDFNDGVLVEASYTQEHAIRLTNLAPGSLYYFTIESENNFLQRSTAPYQFFITPAAPDVSAPASPQNIQAVWDKKVLLTWNNPKDIDFSIVRIVRNENRPRSSPFLGVVVYEGRKTSVQDSRVVPGKKYYYTFYSKDHTGNYSPGIATSIVIPTTSPEPLFPPETLPSVPSVEPEVIIEPSRGDTVIPFSAFTQEIDNGLRISIAGPRVYKNIEDMWLSIPDPLSQSRVIEYIFAYDANKNEYYTIIPPGNEGVYDATVYAYSDGAVKEISSGQVTVPKASVKNDISRKSADFIEEIVIGVMLLLLLLLALIFRKKIEHIIS